MVAADRDRAVAHHVTGVAGVALAEDHLAAIEAARHRDAGHLLDLTPLEAREDLDAREQLGRVASRVTPLGHCPIIGTAGVDQVLRVR
jgi:hypothetical protein